MAIKPIRIFLNYAREDELVITGLYKRLRDCGYLPWMDKKDIVGGERWEVAIERAIRDSDLFVSCLSTRSVSKRGVIQREMKLAFEIAEERFEEDIYIIPLRLEDCDVPRQLRQYQWIDFFADDGWNRLIGAVEEGIQRLQQ